MWAPTAGQAGPASNLVLAAIPPSGLGALREMNVKQDVYHVSGAYVRIARFFFLALAVAGLLGTITGVFAQSAQVQLTISNAGCPATSASRGGIGYTCHGTR